jgi:serine/threonine-protein kinase RsbW
LDGKAILCAILQDLFRSSPLPFHPYAEPWSSNSMDTLTLPARLNSLERFLSFVLERAEKAGASEERLFDMRLGLEEILTNIFSYAYPEGEGHVEVSFSIQSGGKLSIQVTDWGIPFDPLAFDPPNLERDFSEREVGGLGIYLARRVAHQIVYERTHDTNYLTIFFDIQTNSYKKERI